MATTNGTDTEFRDLSKSVKHGDLPAARGGFAYFLVPNYDPSFTALPYDLPPADYMLRDQWLRYSTKAETMWASAVYIAISKLQSLAYNISGNIPLRVNRAQQLLLHAEGGHGWVRFIGIVGRDYLTTDNGAFIEIERYSGAQGARIKGLHHLDSLRCRRTGDPEIPVLYRSDDGREHELRWWQVVDLVDMPESRAGAFGMGQCAANRAWRTVVKLAAIERYVYEKVSGRRPLALHFVSGVAQRQIEDIIAGAQASADARGLSTYMGAALAGVMDDRPPALVTIPLAELPDGFDPDTERKDGYLKYADAIGLDPADLQPLSGQGLGTGTQSIILSEKASGKGLRAFIQDFTHKMNELVLDDKTTFAFTENDLRDQKDKADIAKTRADTRKTMIESGEITPAQALQMAVDADDAPREFLAADETAFEDLSDTEKPVEREEEGQGAQDWSEEGVRRDTEIIEKELVESLKEARLSSHTINALLPQIKEVAAILYQERLLEWTKARIAEKEASKAAELVEEELDGAKELFREVGGKP